MMMHNPTRDIGLAVLKLLGIDSKGITGFDLHVEMGLNVPMITIRRYVREAGDAGVTPERNYDLVERDNPLMQRVPIGSEIGCPLVSHPGDSNRPPAPLGTPPMDSANLTTGARQEYERKLSPCPDCHGTGTYQGLNAVEPCPTCGGKS